MKFRRFTLLANVVVIGATLPAVGLPVATSLSAALPLYEYVNSGPTTWSTQALASELHGHHLLGSAHAAAADGEVALAARINNDDIGLFTQNASGTSSFVDVTSLTGAPRAAADPAVFFDPWGNVDLIYVSTQNRLVLVATAAARSPRVAHVVSRKTIRAFNVTDLTLSTHVAMSLSLPSVSVSGMSAQIFDRSTKNDAIMIPMTWQQLAVPPAVGSAVNITLATNSPPLLGDPVSLAGATSAFAATTVAGHVDYFSEIASGAWSLKDLTNLDSGPANSGILAMASSGTQIYIAGLSMLGHVELFSVSASLAAAVAAKSLGGLAGHIVANVTKPPASWTLNDLTTMIAGSPIFAGQIFLNATPKSLDVAGRAANWGDVYDFSSPQPTTAWASSDVSLDAGASTSASGGVTGVENGFPLELLSTSAGTYSPRGVGVYAIPYVDWGRAISDGWPIISETGGLGTMTAPWVSYPTPSALTQSPDFVMGKSITDSKRRETWLSFWTVSGPLTPASQTLTSYYSHGFLAGQWVAQQIDEYSLHGEAVKPNWVILDPEGYPDNHSALDAPGGSSPAIVHKYAAFWANMLKGWSDGILAVNPSLHPGVYASQSEYRNYSLTDTAMPVFQAIAFGGGGPVRVPGSAGHNILGYIAFDATCTPQSTLRAQENTLVSSPWGGQFNTLQFNAGVYCAP